MTLSIITRSDFIMCVFVPGFRFIDVFLRFQDIDQLFHGNEGHLVPTLNRVNTECSGKVPLLKFFRLCISSESVTVSVKLDHVVLLHFSCYPFTKNLFNHVDSRDFLKMLLFQGVHPKGLFFVL